MSCPPSSKSMPNACCGNDGVIDWWIICYVTIVRKKKTRHSLEVKDWIGALTIAMNAARSDVFSNKPSPVGNGKHPCCMPMMNHIPCELGILYLTINTVFNFFSQIMPLTIYTGGCQRGGHAYRTIMSPVWSFVCGPHPTLQPSSQVPCALDPVRFGRSHTHRHPGGVSIGSTNPSSHQPPVYTTQLSCDPACVLGVGGGLFWKVTQASVGWDGMECGHGSAIRQTPLCLWFGYGTMVLVEFHFPTISTLWRHDRGTDRPSHVTGPHRHCRHPRRRQSGLSHPGDLNAHEQ